MSYIDYIIFYIILYYIIYQIKCNQIKDVLFHPDLGDEVSRKWYQEIEHWSFRSHGPKETSPPNVHVGYFSAMMWRSTTRFGIGLSEHNGKLFIVARYYPHPNTQGEFEDNVMPLKDINDMFDGESMKASDFNTILTPDRVHFSYLN